MILTVSPVQMIATYEPRHVLVSSIANKSILRAAADALARDCADVAYFPSYEIITGPQSRGAYLDPDLRTINARGLAQVMSVFAKHYLSDAKRSTQVVASTPIRQFNERDLQGMEALAAVICDEELLDRPD